MCIMEQRNEPDSDYYPAMDEECDDVDFRREIDAQSRLLEELNARLDAAPSVLKCDHLKRRILTAEQHRRDLEAVMEARTQFAVTQICSLPPLQL
jgi:hypothetical protein